MKIQVLGSGCATCANLNKAVTKVVEEMKLDTQVEYISGAEGIQKIISLGAMSSPVLVINDQVAMTGYTPDQNKIRKIISKYLGK